MAKTLKFGFILILVFLVAGTLFYVSYYSSSSYWSAFALNMLTDLVGAVVIAALLQRSLTNAYKEFLEEKQAGYDLRIPVNERYFLESTTRMLYYILFETPPWVELMAHKDEGGKRDTSNLVEKDVLKLIPRINFETIMYLYFGRKDSKVESVLLNILRAILKEAFADQKIPSPPILPTGKNMNAYEAEIIPLLLNVFAELSPKLLESKEFQVLAHPTVIDALKNMPEIVDSINKNLNSLKNK